MTKKEELNDYDEKRAMSKVNDLFEHGSISGQNWHTSLFEAHVNSLIGAPIAIFAHILLLMAAGLAPSWENAAIFASASWPVFFYLSVGRIFIFRRIFEKYGVNLEPITLFKRLCSKLNHGNTQTEEEEKKT